MSDNWNWVIEACQIDPTGPEDLCDGLLEIVMFGIERNIGVPLKIDPDKIILEEFIEHLFKPYCTVLETTSLFLHKGSQVLDNSPSCCHIVRSCKRRITSLMLVQSRAVRSLNHGSLLQNDLVGKEDLVVFVG